MDLGTKTLLRFLALSILVVTRRGEGLRRWSRQNMTKRIMEREVTNVVFGSEIFLISMVRKIYCNTIRIMVIPRMKPA